MNIKDFAEKFIKAEDEAWQKGDFNALEKMEDPKVVYHMPFGLPDMVGHEAHKQDIVGSRQSRSDIKLEWRYLTGEGNLYAVSLKMSYRVTGQKPGGKIPIGKKVSQDEILVGRVKNGKMVEGWANGSRIVTD